MLPTLEMTRIRQVLSHALRNVATMSFRCLCAQCAAQEQLASAAPSDESPGGVGFSIAGPSGLQKPLEQLQDSPSATELPLVKQRARLAGFVHFSSEEADELWNSAL